MPELSKTQSNGRVNTKYSIKQSGTLNIHVCSIPLGSPTVFSKRPYVHVPVVPWPAVVCGAGHERGVVRGWARVYGWVIRVGIPGGYYPGTQLLEEGSMTAKRAPESPPCRGGVEWVVMEAGRTWDERWVGDGPGTTLRARSGPCRALPVPGPCRDPPWRDSGSRSLKLVKTGKCH